MTAPDARIELLQDGQRVPRFPDLGDAAVLDAVQGKAGVVEVSASRGDAEEVALRRSPRMPPHRHDVTARDREVVDDREVGQGGPLLPEPLLDPMLGVVAGLAGHRGRVHQDVRGGDLGHYRQIVTAQYLLEPAAHHRATRLGVDRRIPP